MVDLIGFNGTDNGMDILARKMAYELKSTRPAQTATIAKRHQWNRDIRAIADVLNVTPRKEFYEACGGLHFRCG